MPPQHSPGRWEGLKPYIRQLYVTEGRQLKEVDEIMRHEHNFHATERMYKQRLRKWNFQVKSVKDTEWQVMDSIWTSRKAEFGKDTRFKITKSGVAIHKGKKDIEKHFKRVTKANLTPEAALSKINDDVLIEWYTPPGSPVPIGIPPPRPTDSLGPIFSRDPPQQPEPSRSTSGGRNLASPVALDAVKSPSIEDASPLSFSSGSDESEIYLDPDTSAEPSPSSSLENLASGFRSLALKMIEPGSCRFSADDELLLNQLLSGAVESEHGVDIGAARISCNGSAFRVDFESLAEPLIVASDWAAHVFLWCYWTCHHQLDRAQASRASALVAFRHMLRNPNDNVHTGLSWLTVILSSHGYTALLGDFLSDCCSMIDEEGKTPFYGPLYRYSLATISNNQADLATYGSQLEHCHSLIRNVYNAESASWLISNYLIASHSLHLGDNRQAASRLEECLPVSERRMGRYHLVTINCLAILYRAYLAQGETELAMTTMQNAVDRCERAIGKQSPYRLQMLSTLAQEFNRIGRLEEAERIFRDVLEDQIKFMGLIRNGRTWWTFDRLKEVLKAQGKDTEASELHEEIYQRHGWAWTNHLRAQEGRIAR